MFDPNGERLSFSSDEEEPFRKQTPLTNPPLFNVPLQNPPLFGPPPAPGNGGTQITPRQKTSASRTRLKAKKLIRAADRVI